MVDLIEGRSLFQPTQYVICLPNQFICDHTVDLLPDWSQPVGSVILVLQRCSCSLLNNTPEAKKVKNRLRQRFLVFGATVARSMTKLDYLTEIFDPASGAPTRSRSGVLRVDDVALVHSLLSYAVIDHDGCSVLLHPLWNDAVYPSTIITSASPITLTSVIRCIVECQLYEFATRTTSG
jgi:hypothetical protein